MIRSASVVCALVLGSALTLRSLDGPGVAQGTVERPQDAGQAAAPQAGIDMARQRIASGRMFVWDDGGPVSMAAWSGRTPNGVRVNYVYTPAERRGRGYASACVADLTQHLLNNVAEFCCLVTDLGNPTSNSIYQRIGYQPVCDLSDFILLPAHETVHRT